MLKTAAGEAGEPLAEPVDPAIPPLEGDTAAGAPGAAVPDVGMPGAGVSDAVPPGGFGSSASRASAAGGNGAQADAALIEEQAAVGIPGTGIPDGIPDTPAPRGSADEDASSLIQELLNAVSDVTGLDIERDLLPELHKGWFHGMRPVRTLITAGILDSSRIDKLATTRVGFMAIEPMNITPETASMLPQWFCEQHGVVPVSFDGETFTVASVVGLRHLVKTELEEIVQCPVVYRITSSEAAAACIVALPSRRSAAVKAPSGQDADSSGTANTSVANWKTLTQPEDDDREVSRHVKALMTRAVAVDASDIHIQTELNNSGATVVTAHLRRLGDLVPHDVYNTEYGYKLINRLKVAGGFDVDPTKPCDGRYDITIPGSGRYDLRLTGMPLVQGQMLVVRMLPQMRKGKRTLEDLFPVDYSDLAERIHAQASQPQGMLLVVGSTGTGKSTTLTAMTRPLADNPSIKLVTVEDPVENLIRGAQQVAVTSRLDFSSALRGFLRSDPDAILLGEIRDQETASMAVRAAQTGHIVFSTLHASSVEMAPGRLAEMGIPRASLADVLLGVISQRLVKTLCETCSSALPGGRRSPEPRGCDACANTGWGGRMAIAEFMEVDHRVAALIADGAPAREVRDEAQPVSYSQFAARLIDCGITTREAVVSQLGRGYDPSFEDGYDDEYDADGYSTNGYEENGFSADAYTAEVSSG